MPLYILGPAVVLGIGLIVLLTHLLGFSRPYVFTDTSDAQARWLREWPSDEVDDVVLSADRHAALVITQAGPGIVWAMGADTVAKRLTRADVRRLEDGLRVDLPDFTARRLRLRLGQSEADDWAQRISGAEA
jgi:hypothetical protein